METLLPAAIVSRGACLETFLVEWKHATAVSLAEEYIDLETFLVEWKHLPPLGGDGKPLTLKPS